MLEKGLTEGEKREVTFILPNEAAGKTVHLCGEFNDWSKSSLPMFLDGAGNYRVTVLLENGRRYRYRYLVDGERWENDWQADDYVTNEFSGEDSVVEV